MNQPTTNQTTRNSQTNIDFFTMKFVQAEVWFFAVCFLISFVSLSHFWLHSTALSNIIGVNLCTIRMASSFKKGFQFLNFQRNEIKLDQFSPNGIN